MSFLKKLEGMPISFAIVTLFLGVMIGSAGGSLLSRVFGFHFLDQALFAESVTIITDFYFLSKVSVRITPGAIAGFLITAVILYRKSGENPSAFSNNQKN